MKKFLLTFTICQSFLLFAVAQKNTILVSGNFNLANTKVTNPPSTFSTLGEVEFKNSTFNFLPIIGYQFSDNWTIGFKTNIKTTNATRFEQFNNNSSRKETIKQNYLGFGPLLRYSKKISNIFVFYTQFDANFGTQKDNYSFVNTPTNPFNANNTSDSKIAISDFNIIPALFINIKNNFGLNLNIGGLNYISNTQRETKQKAKELNFSFGKTFEIGISKNFNVSKTKKK